MTEGAERLNIVKRLVAFNAEEYSDFNPPFFLPSPFGLRPTPYFLSISSDS